MEAEVEMEPKKQLKVYIDPELERRLRKLIKAKFERFYGALSQEVEDALEHWVGAHESSLDAYTKKHTRINPAFPKVHVWAREIIRELGLGTLQVRRVDLERAIAKVRGSDTRTQEKWIGFLVKEGYLKIIGFGIFEVL